MTSHFLVDKSLQLEAAFGGYAILANTSFAEPGVQPQFTPDRLFVLRRLDLDLSIDPVARTASVETRLEIAPLPSGLGEVVLDLDQVEVDRVEDGAGSALGWRRDGPRLTVTGLPPEGGTVVVRTHGVPDAGLYFTGPTPAEPDRIPMAWTQAQDQLAHNLFPCVDHPSVKVPMRIRITAPRGYTVVSNGRMTGREPAGKDAETWSWEQAEPIPVYLFTAVVARLVTVEDSWRGRAVRYLAPEGNTPEVLLRIFARTPAMLAHFSERFGVDYPWPRYDQVVVHDFIFGGMENVAATTLTDLVLTDDRAALDHDSDDLIAHELAHQWFGDLVTCQDWSQAWLNEGWATYSEHVWALHARGQDEADYGLFRQLEEYLKEDRGRYRRSIVDYRFREPIDLFDRHLYEKGALVLHTLRSTLGDGPFWVGVGAYLRAHAHGSVHTRDFQRAMERASGRNLDRFFQQWVHGAGHPSLEITVEHDEGLLTIAVKQTQTGTDVAEAFHLPLRVTLVFGGRAEALTLPVRERERTWSLPTAVVPDRVDVDAGFGVLSALVRKGSRRLSIASLQGDPCVVGRIRAARALGEDAGIQAMSALVDALHKDPFWGVRAEVAAVLGARGTSIAREALLAALAEPHPKARLAVVTALGEIPHPDVAAALTQLAVGGDPSVKVEGEAAKSLGRIRAANAVQTCASLLCRESWGEVLRARALEGMAASRDPAALPHLLAWTGEDRRMRARAAAATGLGRLADEVESTRQPAVDRLKILAAEAPFRVQMSAIAALGLAKDPGASAVLQSVHQTARDGRARRAAYEALSRINGGRAGDSALGTLRADLDTLREDNRKLRDRIAKLESRDIRTPG